MNIPTKEECIKILKENNVPDNIIAHVKTVCDFSMKIVDLLDKKGIKVNRALVAAAALLHDIKKLSQNDHVLEGYEYMKSLGYPEVALVIKKHGLQHLGDESFEPKTWEEKIVFYADKRCKGSRLVSVEERFKYVRERYSHYDVEKELKLTKEIEKELLEGEGI